MTKEILPHGRPKNKPLPDKAAIKKAEFKFKLLSRNLLKPKVGGVIVRINPDEGFNG